MDPLEDSKDQITKLDITLHEKSQDLTDGKLRLDYKNLYAGDDQSQQDIQPDFMTSGPENLIHGKSYDLVDTK